MHVTEAVLECTDTGLVDIGLVAHTKWILLGSQGFARRCHVQASGRSFDCGLVLFFCDQLQPVSVVVSELGVVDHLRIDVDAWVDESNGIKVKFNGRSSNDAASNIVVLLLEVIGVNCVVVSGIRLAPNAESVVV